MRIRRTAEHIRSSRVLRQQTADLVQASGEHCARTKETLAQTRALIAKVRSQLLQRAPKT